MPKKINCIHANKIGECEHPAMKERFLFFTWKPYCIEYGNDDCRLKEMHIKPSVAPSPSKVNS
jgi:hypothetical protein